MSCSGLNLPEQRGWKSQQQSFAFEATAGDGAALTSTASASASGGPWTPVLRRARIGALTLLHKVYAYGAVTALSSSATSDCASALPCNEAWVCSVIAVCERITPSKCEVA